MVMEINWSATVEQDEPFIIVECIRSVTETESYLCYC